MDLVAGVPFTAHIRKILHTMECDYGEKHFKNGPQDYQKTEGLFAHQYWRTFHWKAVFILIVLFVRNEVSYDRFHRKVDRIYRIVTGDPQDKNSFVGTPAPLVR